MNEQLLVMLEIQDLKSKAREIERGELGDLEETHFGVDPDQAVTALRNKATELMGGLRADTRGRFKALAERADRAVVPVVDGTCFGCYVSIPTATAGEREPNSALQSCESCGRFLYILG